MTKIVISNVAVFGTRLTPGTFSSTISATMSSSGCEFALIGVNLFNVIGFAVAFVVFDAVFADDGSIYFVWLLTRVCIGRVRSGLNRDRLIFRKMFGWDDSYY